MEKKNKAAKEQENISGKGIEAEQEEKECDTSLDEIENAPDELDELFSEPPILDLSYDEEPTDDELKLEEMTSNSLTMIFCRKIFRWMTR